MISWAGISTACSMRCRSWSLQAKEGKVTPLASPAAPARPRCPMCRRFMESGCRITRCPAGSGILAPAGTPPAIASGLRDEVAKAVAAPDVVATLGSQGNGAARHAARRMGDLSQVELDVYTKITKDANIKPE